MRRSGSHLGWICALLLAPGAAQAAAIFYTDRASWEAAAGAPTFTEDFSGFSQDTPFRQAPVALSGLSIEQVGGGSFRNLIDVGPTFDFTEHNGTNHASIFSNAPGGSAPEAVVVLTFEAENLAFGFDHWAAADGEGARLEIWDGGALLDSFDLSNAFGGFTGYVLDAGDRASHVVLRSIQSLVGPGDPGEGYGIDDLAGVAVPEPGTALLTALGLGLLASRRARRR